MADKWRRKKEPKHIRLYASITNSEAWKHLSGNAVKVLLALVARDDGTRNGNIGFSGREAAIATGLSDKTCWRCLIELQEKGFIACTQKGAFSRKVMHSSLWRYTWQAWPGGRPAAPTRDFEKWGCTEIRGCKICHRAAEDSSVGLGNTNSPAEEFTTAPFEMPQIPVCHRTEDSSALTINHRDSRGASALTTTNESPPDTGGAFAAETGQVEMWAMPAPAQPPCEQCGETITALSKNGLKRFCSEPCRKRAERTRAKQRRKQRQLEEHRG